MTVRDNDGQASLFAEPRQKTTKPGFDGATIKSEDSARLSSQLDFVLKAMTSREWWTLDELQDYVERRLGRRVTQTSVSARLRDLRKKRFGGHVIERRNNGGGLFRYRLGKRLALDDE